MQILGAQVLPNGQTVVMAEGVECFEVANWLEDDPYPGRWSRSAAVTRTA